MYRSILIFIMFTLRTLSKNGEEQNHYLGKHYKITSKENSEENFESYIKTELPIYLNKEDVYSFITSENCEFVIPLIKENNYFIINQNGKTFDNLTNN